MNKKIAWLKEHGRKKGTDAMRKCPGKGLNSQTLATCEQKNYYLFT